MPKSTSSSTGKKGVKLARFELVPPEALWALAEVYGVGGLKYDDRNWEKGIPFSQMYGALQRHAIQFWGGEDVDPEDGQKHMASVMWHAAGILTMAEIRPDLDDRPRKTKLESRQVA